MTRNREQKFEQHYEALMRVLRDAPAVAFAEFDKATGFRLSAAMRGQMEGTNLTRSSFGRKEEKK